MKTQTHTSPRRIALGAALLILAATASSCGMALPTQPALDSDAGTQRSAATTRAQDTGGGLIDMSDDGITSGGPDVTSAPPAGEDIVPTPSSLDPGNSTWGHSHKKPKQG